MTTAILTPKTPVCFREGILFKLNSLLVNLTESFTSICTGRRDVVASAFSSSRPESPGAPRSFYPLGKRANWGQPPGQLSKSQEQLR